MQNDGNNESFQSSNASEEVMPATNFAEVRFVWRDWGSKVFVAVNVFFNFKML